MNLAVRTVICFNSRTPGGVRPILLESWTGVKHVSIHAPREGCDVALAMAQDADATFQFTHPGRGATGHIKADETKKSFQFTHPGRGATQSWGLLGDDVVFQFTHPGRGATVLADEVVAHALVSIHAPREGCDTTTSESISRG